MGNVSNAGHVWAPTALPGIQQHIEARTVGVVLTLLQLQHQDCRVLPDSDKLSAADASEFTEWHKEQECKQADRGDRVCRRRSLTDCSLSQLTFIGHLLGIINCPASDY